MLVGAAHEFLQIGKRQQRDEAHGVGPHHAVGGELVLLVVVVGHHTEQRAVGNVDHGVADHHEDVEEIGIEPLAGKTKVGRIEQKGKDDAQRHRAKDDPGTVGAPTALRAVGYCSHDGIGDDIYQACHEHQHGRIIESQSENISKEQRKGYGHDFPCDASGCCVSQRIANLLFKLDLRHLCNYVSVM